MFLLSIGMLFTPRHGSIRNFSDQAPCLILIDNECQSLQNYRSLT